ncbi:hypothetical protein D3C85_1657420 [compost metagenome]
MGGQVRIDQCLACICFIFTCGSPFPPALTHLLERPLAGLPGQRFLGFEMTIEAAMSQAGRGHHIDDADAMQAALAEQPRGGVDDDFAVEVGLFAGNSGHWRLTGI